MYGTIFRMRPKAGKQQAIVDLFHEWERDRRPNVEGVVAGFLFKPNSRSEELTGVAVFTSKDAFLVNANAPEQHEWYTRIRGLLEDDPDWDDGEVVSGGA